jgi:hypothetical protein
MKRHTNKWVLRALVSLALFGAASTSQADERKDARIIANMGSDDPRIVENALEDLEDQSPPSDKVVVQARKLLEDPRPSVRVKAVVVLGKIHAKLDEKDIDAICFMLKSHDVREAVDTRKSFLPSSRC